MDRRILALYLVVASIIVGSALAVLASHAQTPEVVVYSDGSAKVSLYVEKISSLGGWSSLNITMYVLENSTVIEYIGEINSKNNATFDGGFMLKVLPSNNRTDVRFLINGTVYKNGSKVEVEVAAQAVYSGADQTPIDILYCVRTHDKQLLKEVYENMENATEEELELTIYFLTFQHVELDNITVTNASGVVCMQANGTWSTPSNEFLRHKIEASGFILINGTSIRSGGNVTIGMKLSNILSTIAQWLDSVGLYVKYPVPGGDANVMVGKLFEDFTSRFDFVPSEGKLRYMVSGGKTMLYLETPRFKPINGKGIFKNLFEIVADNAGSGALDSKVALHGEGVYLLLNGTAVSEALAKDFPFITVSSTPPTPAATTTATTTRAPTGGGVVDFLKTPVGIAAVILVIAILALAAKLVSKK